MLQETNQTKEKMHIAVFNAWLHRGSICPANHHVEYGYGWYYLDGNPERNTKVTRLANELWESGAVVLYSSTWNTYVLHPDWRAF